MKCVIRNCKTGNQRQGSVINLGSNASSFRVSRSTSRRPKLGLTLSDDQAVTGGIKSPEIYYLASSFSSPIHRLSRSPLLLSSSSPAMGFLPGPTDPFYELMQPPSDETPAQKTARQKRELDAQRHSDSIDEDIKLERARSRKDRKIIKVLLLGQSESGELSP